ncbi:MAG TPA: hypothetical protein VFZ69_16585 [Longimicrobiales bacterium]
MNSINFRAPLAWLGLAAALAACENPVTPADHEEPEGLVLLDGATEVLRVIGRGAVGVASDTLRVAAGAQTPELTVSFIDEHGDALTIDEENTLAVVSDSPATATWQGSAAGVYAGRVSGLAAGTTTLRFQLYHGSVETGHVDAEFRVPVTVTAVQP